MCFPGRIVDMDELTVTAADGAQLCVGRAGEGAEVVVLPGGPGCVHYLADEGIAPRGVRSWFPVPRGVGRSGGGPHDMARAVEDLEDVRRALGVARWVVLGHSWGSDLAVRYALEHPDRVAAVVGIAGHGLHKDRSWSEVYHARRHAEDAIRIDWSQQVHAALSESFLEWIHEPGLLRSLADSPVRMRFIAAANDIRPNWPLRQLAELVPAGSFEVVAGVDHNFWTTDPERWTEVVTEACTCL
jgi:proline iminopeptidase